LDRHTDAFGDHRMGFTGDIAGKEDAVIFSRPDSRMNGASGEKAPLQSGILQGFSRTMGGLQDMRQHRLARLAAMTGPGPGQNVTPYAAGERNTAVVAFDQPAIAA